MRHRIFRAWSKNLTIILFIATLTLVSCSKTLPGGVGPTIELTSQITEIPSITPMVTRLPTKTSVPDPTITHSKPPQEFDGEKAFSKVEDQMAFGPRWPGSSGHREVGDYIIRELKDLGWQVEEQSFTYRDVIGRNIIAKVNQDRGPVIIVGAHYDTRKVADRSPDSSEAAPGAVDGASGVAVLLELARSLELHQTNKEVWLAFFDVEDNGSGGIPGYDWIVGSTYMANNLQIMPEAMVLVDMVGDADQQLYLEGNSNPDLQQRIWQIAGDLGFGDYFINEYRYSLIDDHLPFVQRGIPAIDIIDFDYPYWHTIEDTTDKVSPESLARVGLTLETWLEDN